MAYKHESVTPRYHDRWRCEPTPLQTWTAALFDVLDDARDQLDERAWQAFVSIACDRIGYLGAQVFLAEMIRAGREREERDAA